MIFPVCNFVFILVQKMHMLLTECGSSLRLLGFLAVDFILIFDFAWIGLVKP